MYEYGENSFILYSALWLYSPLFCTAKNDHKSVGDWTIVLSGQVHCFVINLDAASSRSSTPRGFRFNHKLIEGRCFRNRKGSKPEQDINTDWHQGRREGSIQARRFRNILAIF